MARINIDSIYKMAEVFEEEAVPQTLPTGTDFKPYKDKPTAAIEEVSPPPTARFTFNRDLSARTVKDLMMRFNHIYNLSRGAGSLLSSMKRDMILHPTMGIDTYIDSIEKELSDIVGVVGRKSD